MGKIDIKYVDKFFKMVEHCEDVTDFYYEEYNKNLELKTDIATFLELVISYADEKDISEVHKSDGHYADNRFCYWIRFKGKVIELGMYYDDIVYATIYPNDIYEEYVIDCEEVIKFHNNKNNVVPEEKPKTYKKTTKAKNVKD